MIEWLILAAIIGAVIGSFLNMVHYRYPLMLKRQWHAECAELLNQPVPKMPDPFNFLFPRSHCPQCQKPIPFFCNIPIISYIFLRGKCLFCKKQIPFRYLLTELLSTVLSVFIVWKFGITTQAAALLIFTWLLIALAMIDIEHHLLPDTMTLSLLWIGLLLSTQHLFISPIQAILGAVSGYLFLWLVAFVYKTFKKQEGMGYGDCKMLAMFGAWIGPLALLNVILTASLLALIISYAVLGFKKSTHQRKIPFGPYLAVAGWWTVIFGPQFMIWLMRWM